ncbi:MAG: hypothetical protein HYZ29_11190 [Myxococcales bacterium]|nr:hypothetical protein [Myxococcales bacterium]
MLTRKEFLCSTLAATGALLGLGATNTGCGGDDDGDGGGGGSTGSCSSTMTNNHGHSLSVSAADLEAGQQKTYSIKGSSAHDHEVMLTANHFASLKAGKSVFVESTDAGSGHTHNVSVKCS